MELVPGESRIGSYTMEQQIGSGAFASVWLAHHNRTNLKAAINQNAEAAELAATEVNFYEFFEHAQFAEIVKVKYKMKY